ncbi:MAG TPA: glycosyltransferase family 2 protein [Chthoniobacteraceae bacterium]|nr:glycosyltransferase family 2 protein [Chthoniobacteraceae bacterium]
MKVSLVTVSFNAAPTIEETIRSVLGQQGVELEYIVVDGASGDGTAEIIRRYGPRLAWWVSEPDRGQADALNKAFARATGDVLGFLNADDLLMPGSLHAVCERFAAEPDAEIVYGGVEWIDFEGNALGSHLGDISNLDDILDIYRVWWGERQWVQPEVFFRRTLKQRVGNFDERYHLAFDYDFWVRCFLAGAKVARLPSPLVRFRRHAGQKSNERERAANEIRAILGGHLAARAPIGAWRRLTLGAQLSYDTYQASPASLRPPFASALVRHPSWLLSAAVRQRLLASAFHRAPP